MTILPIRRCSWRATRASRASGSGPRLASCGLSETPPPCPAPLPPVHVPLQVHGHLITGAEISFLARYPVTSARQNYRHGAHLPRTRRLGPDADVARGAVVHIHVGALLALSAVCPRSSTIGIKVEYVRFIHGLPEPTPLGSVTGASLRARTPRRYGDPDALATPPQSAVTNVGTCERDH